MSVVIDGITHLLFHGISVADSTACGMMVVWEIPRSTDDTDCMACIAYEFRSEPIEHNFGKALRFEWVRKAGSS